MSIFEKFHTQITGNSQSLKKIVFLHGLLGFAANWRTIARRFESDFEILVYDQRGHGRSIKPESGYSPEDYAGDLKSLLAELNWKKIFLVGHSLGARNAIQFTADYPGCVEKLVIEDLGPEKRLTAGQRTIEYLKFTPAAFFSRRQAREFFQGQFVQKFQQHPKIEMIAQFLNANIEEKSNGDWSWKFNEKGILESIEKGRQRDRWKEYQSITCPILVLRGEHSEELSREEMQKMKAINENTTAREIPDSGHWIHADQPELFVQELKTFLASG